MSVSLLRTHDQVRADSIGASGMFVSILAVIAVITRVDQRAAFMSAFGYVLASDPDWS